MRVQLVRAGVAVAACVGLVAGIAFGAKQGYPGDHVDLATGNAWLASDVTGQLTLVDGATGAVAAQVGVAPAGTRIGVAQAGAAGYAALPTGEVARVDATTWSTVRADLAAGSTPPELFPSGALLYAVDPDTGDLGSFDARTLAVRGATTRLPAPVQPQSVTVDDNGRLWAYDADSGTVIRLDSGVRKDAAVKLVPGGLGLLTITQDHPVAVIPGSGQVSVLDPDSGSPVRALAVDAPADGTVSVAGAPDRQRIVLAIGSRGGLVVCDLDTMTGCRTSIAVAPAGDALGVPAVVADRAYVPDHTTGRVVIVDLGSFRILGDPVVLPGARPFDLVVRDGIVFYNDPESALAGILEPDATVRAVTKYRTAGTTPDATPGGPASATTGPLPAVSPTPPRAARAAPPLAPVKTSPPPAPGRTCATWSTVDMPTPGGLVTRFADVSGQWAVGQSGPAQIVERWDGAGWQVVATPATGASSALTGVSAPAADLAWAVGSTTPTGGDAPRPLIERWDGTSWQVVPGPADDGAVLNAVWAAGTGDAWAVGADRDGPLALHWDGTQWQPMPRPDAFGPAGLVAVSGTGPDDVWAVGTAGTAPHRQAVLEHWDGARWRISATPAGTDIDVVSVRARAADDVWAVGQYTPRDAGAAQPYALHWDGRSWLGTAFPGLGTGINRLTDAVPRSAGDVWLVAGPPAGAGRPAVERWNGSAWSAATGGAGTAPGTTLVRAVPLAGGRVLAVGAISTAAGDRPVSATGTCGTP